MNLIDTRTGEIVGEIREQTQDDHEQSSMSLVLIDGNFKFTPHGLEVVGNPTFDDWMACGQGLRDIKQGLHFAIGDWLIYGRNRWPDRYAQGMSIFGFAYQTLATDVWVAEGFPHSRRRELPHSYHRAVRALPSEKQDEILDEAEAEEWDRETIRAKVREVRNPEPRIREKRIGGMSICCDLLFDPDGPLVQIDHDVKDSPVINSAFYRPGWKSVNRLVQAANDKMREGWTCRPILIYGTIGWTITRR